MPAHHPENTVSSIIDLTTPLPSSASVTEMTEIVLPQHANALGTVFGGTVMAWIDVCAAIVAGRHARTTAVTAAVDDLVFLSPIRVGDVVRIQGRLNAVFRTSMEIEVSVASENRRSSEFTQCVQAWLTFVALNDDGQPMCVRPLEITSDDDRVRKTHADKRRADRLARRKATRS